MRGVSWRDWALGWWVAIVMAGGVAQVVADRTAPTVRTAVREVSVLPAGQAIVTGTVTALHGTDVLAPVLRLPIVLTTGTVTIRNALTGDGRATIAWQGGRPFRLEDDGAIDLGPTTVAVDARGVATWPLDGIRSLVRGRYVLRAPVALGAGGLAQPRDQVDFLTDEHVTIETHGASVTTGPATLHLDGPGQLVLDGRFTVRTRAATRAATHLDFGPGSFVLDLDPRVEGVQVRATLQGPLR